MSSVEDGNRDSIGADETHGSCKRFLLAEILFVTNNFSDQLVIGKGGFGKVYRGFIDNGAIPIAIKRLNAESKQGAREFWTEINTLSKLRHTHLVTLIGFSDDEDEMILVYEYIPNGTLADRLYGSSREEDVNDTCCFTWGQRLDICFGAACGLDYLHGKSIIHRDVKTANILLDEIWVAKIADFGLSKVANTSQMQSHISTDVKGTFGYLDPEYFFTGRLTTKSDVYAFGVVLLEVLCARPPVDIRAEEVEQQSLALWAQKCFKKGKVLDLIDPSLREQVSPNCAKMFSKVAIRCLHKDPKRRPTMAEVVKILKLVSESQRKELFRRFTMTEVRAATNNFNEHQVIGNGCHTKVYIGHIDGGIREVIIKRWTDGLSRSQINVINMEIEVQSQLHHLNLVTLIGYKMDEHEAVLVYDYMANRSLHYHLYERTSDALSWEKRLVIGLSIARALQYLRTKWPSIHQYLPLTNIVFDQNWNTKVLGFRYSCLTPVSKDHESASDSGLLNAGNKQYIDPEFYTTKTFSRKSDVYSFGVILLELLCGRSRMIYSRMEGKAQVSIVQWFKSSVEYGLERLTIDPYLPQPIAPECFKTYVGIALKCVSYESVHRPTMKDVLISLERALQQQKTWLEQIHFGDDMCSPGNLSMEERMEMLYWDEKFPKMSVLEICQFRKDWMNGFQRLTLH